MVLKFGVAYGRLFSFFSLKIFCAKFAPYVRESLIDISQLNPEIQGKFLVFYQFNLSI